MSTLRLGIQGGRTRFEPGEAIAGAAQWEFEAAPAEAAVRLCWFTQGKGTEDAEIVETIAFNAPQAGDIRTFSFTAPMAPYSFSGRLISLIWAVELVLQPKDQCDRVEIVIAPGAQEVVLPASAA